MKHLIINLRQSYLYILFIIASCNAQESKHINYELKLPEILESYDLDKQKIWINIDKSDYKLCIKIDTITIKEYPVVFGKNTVDDKLREGDGCTPEGTFNIISKYPHKSWSFRFLCLFKTVKIRKWYF